MFGGIGAGLQGYPKDPLDGNDDTLPDADEDGIPDLIEDALFTDQACGGVGDIDGDGLPNGKFDPDSDNDDMVDGFEKIYWESRGIAPLGNLDSSQDSVANICDLDADGDGIRDGSELRGWTTSTVQSLDQLVAVVRALCDFDVDSNPPTCKNTEPGDTYPIMNHEVTSSEPSVPDSEGDGLEDGLEYISHSNPRSTDSDTDGIADGDDSDPSVVSFEQPKVAVTGFRQSPPEYAIAGLVVFTVRKVYIDMIVSSASPLAEIRGQLCGGAGAKWEEGVCRHGTLQDLGVAPESHDTTSYSGPLIYYIASLETIADTQIRITAKDRVGNVGEATMDKPSYLGGGANYIGQSVVNTLGRNNFGAGFAGLLSGLFAGFSGQARDLAEFFRNVPGVLSEAVKLMTEHCVIKDATGQCKDATQFINLIIQAVNAIYADIEQQQEDANPNNPGGDFTDPLAERYNTFRKSWFAGYALGFVIFEMILIAATDGAWLIASAYIKGMRVAQGVTAVGALLARGATVFTDFVLEGIRRLAASGKVFADQIIKLSKRAFKFSDNELGYWLNPFKGCRIQCAISPFDQIGSIFNTAFDGVGGSLRWGTDRFKRLDDALDTIHKRLVAGGMRDLEARALLKLSRNDFEKVAANLKVPFGSKRRDITFAEDIMTLRTVPGSEFLIDGFRVGDPAVAYVARVARGAQESGEEVLHISWKTRVAGVGELESDILLRNGVREASLVGDDAIPGARWFDPADPGLGGHAVERVLDEIENKIRKRLIIGQDVEGFVFAGLPRNAAELAKLKSGFEALRQLFPELDLKLYVQGPLDRLPTRVIPPP